MTKYWCFRNYYRTGNVTGMMNNIQNFIHHKQAYKINNKYSKTTAPYNQLLNSLCKKIVLGFSFLSLLSAATPLDNTVIPSYSSTEDSQTRPKVTINTVRLMIESVDKIERAALHQLHQNEFDQLHWFDNTVSNLIAEQKRMRKKLYQTQDVQFRMRIFRVSQIEILQIKQKQTNLLIRSIVTNNERAYQEFLNLRFVYKPHPHNDTGRIVFSVNRLENPLEGQFNLSRCGDASKHVSIATGFRKGINPENKNKVEMWFVPRFFIEQNLDNKECAFNLILKKWHPDIVVGVFLTYGSWGVNNVFFYQIKKNNAELNNDTLYEVFRTMGQWPGCLDHNIRPNPASVFEKFSLCFF